MAEHQNECGVSMCARCRLLTNLDQLTVVESECWATWSITFAVSRRRSFESINDTDENLLICRFSSSDEVRKPALVLDAHWKPP